MSATYTPDTVVALTRGLVKTKLVAYATSDREFVLVELARAHPELCYYDAPRAHCSRGVWYLELSDEGVAIAEQLAHDLSAAWASLCDYERSVLLGEKHEWGAAVGQALEVLRSRGLLDTPKGTMLVAWAKAKA